MGLFSKKIKGSVKVRNGSAKMKRVVSIALIAVLIAGLTSGCTPREKEVPEKSPKSHNVVDGEVVPHVPDVGIVARINQGETRDLKFGDHTWRLLDLQGKWALIITEDIIEYREYNDVWEAMSWEECTLRDYLNGDFLSTFSTRDQELIDEVWINNKNNQWNRIPAGKDTVDKVFLLSIEEVVKYFGDSGLLEEGTASLFALSDEYNDARMAQDPDGNDARWWLRSPGYDMIMASFVCDDGKVELSGHSLIMEDIGVRPALWIYSDDISTPDDAGDSGPDIISKILQGETRDLQFGDYTWQVLKVQHNKALIITEEVIFGHSYHFESVEDVFWENCELREHLNGDFLDTFSREEQVIIIESHVDNPGNPWSDSGGGNDTVDKVFLLNIYELVRCFGGGKELLFPPDDINSQLFYMVGDDFDDARVAMDLDGEASRWLLRTPGYRKPFDSPSKVISVLTSGEILIDGLDVHTGKDRLYTAGVRPALWLDLQKYNIAEQIMQGKTRDLLFGDYAWRVLDVQDDKALIITESVIESRKYHTRLNEITWEDCALREYLNGEFLETFNDRQRKMIIETVVSNPDNLWFKTDGGNDTSDKVFLLSLEEVDELFGDSGDYRNKVTPIYTDNSFSNEFDSDRVAVDASSKRRGWWLRSPGEDGNYVAIVYDGGSVSVDGVKVNSTHGVRPALWISLEP